MKKKLISGITSVSTAGHDRGHVAHLALCNDGSLWIKYSSLELGEPKINPEWENITGKLVKITQVSSAFSGDELAITALCENGSVWTKRDEPMNFKQGIWKRIDKE